MSTGQTIAVVRHNFETAHRLPQLANKCSNLHGHSWWVEVAIGADELTEAGTVVEFGALKAQLRGWVDEYLDHATMLGASDPLCSPLTEAGCKVYQFGVADPVGAQVYARDLSWPTVENVAHLLARVVNAFLGDIDAAPSARVASVTVSETHVNEATWTPT